MYFYLNVVIIDIVQNKSHSLIYSLINLAFLVRFGNLIILALVQYFTSYFLLDLEGDFLYNLKIHYIVAATICTAAAGYIINDYYDVKIDSINKPDRVVIDRKLHRRYALIWNGVLDVSALVFAYLISLKMLFVVFVSIITLWAYSNHFKRYAFSGNFLIAFLSATTVLLIPFEFEQLKEAVLVYASFSFLMTLIREIIKDMQDVQGDKEFNCKTLPIIWGIRRTKILIYLLIAILIFIIVMFLIRLNTMNWLLLLVILGLGYLTLKLVKADTSRSFKKLSSLCKLLMIIGVLSVVLIQ